MKFSELESKMIERGVSTLAEIARALNTTPQAVSNWKARDQVPYHIVAKVESNESVYSSVASPNVNNPLSYEDNELSYSDILLKLAEQIKLILLIAFIVVFATFTYVQFVQVPKYVSSATILLPDKRGSMGGIAGIASQFGVNLPSGASADLSSPSLFPDLLTSRSFAEKIFEKKFYTEKYGKELTLLTILNNGNEELRVGKDTLVSRTLGLLLDMIKYEKSNDSEFSLIIVTAFEPLLAKELAEETLVELEGLNRFYKTQKVNEKTIFIEQRIASVKEELEDSEQSLKIFQEKNRQISSPSLQLEFDRLGRDLEIQKGIYLTLKQQLELAKIEEVQEASILQILDKPQVALNPSNKKVKRSLVMAVAVGIALGVILGLARSVITNPAVEERRKMRRVRNFIVKKGKGMISDRRVSGIISLTLLLGAPYYLGHQSKFPVFFGMYSSKLMFVNIVYVLLFIISTIFFIRPLKKK